MKRFVIVLFISLVLFTVSFAQLSDTNAIDKRNTYYIPFNNFFSDTLFADTSLLNFQFHYPNSVFNNNASLSNHGSPFYSLTFNDYHTDFLNLHNYQNIFIEKEVFTRYYGDSIYTNLFYSGGPDKNKRLNLDFGHILSDNLSYNLKLRYIDGTDAFVNDAKDIRNFNFNVSYQLPSQIYSLDFGYLHKKIRGLENGGVDTNLYFHSDYKPIEYKTNLRNANYFFKNDEYILKHQLKLANLIQKLWKDSLCDMGRLVMKNNFTIQKRVYQDNDTIYFSFFQNSLHSFDSVAMFRNQHTLLWEKEDLLLHGLSTSIGIQHSGIKISDSLSSYTFNSSSFILQARYRFKNVLQLGLFSKTFFQGDFSGNLSQNAFVSFRKSIVRAKYNIGIDKAFPRFFFLHQNSNHFQWDNIFEKERSVNQSVLISSKGFSLEAMMINISHYTYLDKKFIPANEVNEGLIQTLAPIQLSELLTHTKLSLTYELRMKFVQFQLKGVYQKVSNADVLALPDWLVSSKFSYSHEIFNAAMITIGSEAMMHAKYYARAFDPALQEFYLQHNTLVGEYLYLNAFFKLKLKRVNLFLLYSNIGAHFLGKNYYEVPEYPLHPNGIYYGLNWRFYN